jgi:hypothetical protein
MKKNPNLFEISQFNTEDKIKNFAKYIKRKDLSRFLVLYEIFKKQLKIKGSIIECGVHQGGGLFSFAKLSSIFEPYNYHRKIIGFDTFSGFPSSANKKDNKDYAKKGNFLEKVDILEDLNKAEKFFDNERYLNHVKKIELIEGDANQTIPRYLKKNKHLLISLLFLDFDLYKPTKTALKLLLKRVPKGGVVAFDELNNPHWPGETEALLEELNINKLEIQNYNFEPNISFFIL